MEPVGIAVVAFLCILCGAALGLSLGSRLPEHHLASDSKDVVRLSMAMIATLTALVLGLVTASAKSAFDNEDAAVRHASATVLALDRMLADYGAQAKPVRDELQRALAERLAVTWPESGAKPTELAPSSAAPGDRIVADILALAPTTDAQQWYKARALDLSSDVLQARWIVFGSSESSVPPMFLVVIICWLTVLFGSFGLFAPRNGTVAGALLICSLSVAASIFLILEMNTPFSGVMKVSSAPIRYAVSHIDK